MTDEPDPLVEALIAGAAERVKSAAEGALPTLREALADADGRFTSNPRQAAVSALLAVADFLALTCEPGVEHMPALPGARIFEALALDLRELDDGRVSDLLTPHTREFGRPPLDHDEAVMRVHAVVAVECRRLLNGGRGALDSACKHIANKLRRVLPGVDASTLMQWRKDIQRMKASPDGTEGIKNIYAAEVAQAFPRFFNDAATVAQERAQARQELEREALARVKAYAEHLKRGG